MISPLLCGTDKAAVVDSSATSPIQRASSTSSETVGSRGRPSSSGRGGRSRSVDDMLETTVSGTPCCVCVRACVCSAVQTRLQPMGSGVDGRAVNEACRL